MWQYNNQIEWKITMIFDSYVLISRNVLDLQLLWSHPSYLDKLYTYTLDFFFELRLLSRCLILCDILLLFWIIIESYSALDANILGKRNNTNRKHYLFDIKVMFIERANTASHKFDTSFDFITIKIDKISAMSKMVWRNRTIKICIIEIFIILVNSFSIHPRKIINNL